VHGPDPVTFTELTAATGLAKSTTSQLLMALERGGLVRRDDHGHFQPGEMFVRFAWQGGAEAGLTEVAQPHLNRLGRATGETVNLGVGRGDMVEQIAQVDSVYLIGATNWLGRPVPLHCTAIGKVLLAHGAAKLPRWAPASAPWATIASTPACARRRASSTVVAVPLTAMPRFFSIAICSDDGMPNVKLKTGGRSSSTTANCSSKGLAGTGGSTGGGNPSRACACRMISSIGCGSTLRSLS